MLEQNKNRSEDWNNKKTYLQETVVIISWGVQFFEETL